MFSHPQQSTAICKHIVSNAWSRLSRLVSGSGQGLISWTLPNIATVSDGFVPYFRKAVPQCGKKRVGAGEAEHDPLARDSVSVRYSGAGGIGQVVLRSSADDSVRYRI